MKNKSPLALMEQLLMVLVFALAAALCLQGFVLANRISTHMEARNHAVNIAQNAAEVVKYLSGDLEQAARLLNAEWDGNMLQADCESATRTKDLRLNITSKDSSMPLLGTAHIRVLQDEELLFEITVAWQEENADAEK